MTTTRLCLAVWILAGAAASLAAPLTIAVDHSHASAELGPVPMCVPLDRAQLPGAAAEGGHVGLTEAGSVRPESIPAQFAPDAPGASRGTLWWMMPPGGKGLRRFVLTNTTAPATALLQATRDAATGRWEIRERGQLVLGYNYQTNAPGDVLSSIHPNNRKYARARGDYIHPLCGLEGEVLTKDWSVDHPHHRGIYWAWPEVDWRGQRGDLHALQTVFARPTGQCRASSGPVFAQLDAENVWLWEDQTPVVRERVVIRAYRATPQGRFVDLEFHFVALGDPVLLARRDTRHYGGLNVRLATVEDQQIVTHTGAGDAPPRMAWGQVSGIFAEAKEPTGVVILQHPANPDYPGDWVQYPNLNWLQPAFPAAGTRYQLEKGEPLVLRFRLWIRKGGAEEGQLASVWRAYADASRQARLK